MHFDWRIIGFRSFALRTFSFDNFWWLLLKLFPIRVYIFWFFLWFIDYLDVIEVVIMNMYWGCVSAFFVGWMSVWGGVGWPPTPSRNQGLVDTLLYISRHSSGWRWVLLLSCWLRLLSYSWCSHWFDLKLFYWACIWTVNWFQSFHYKIWQILLDVIWSILWLQNHTFGLGKYLWLIDLPISCFDWWILLVLWDIYLPGGYHLLYLVI